jgi:protein-disulfide isomerase
MRKIWFPLLAILFLAGAGTASGQPKPPPVDKAKLLAVGSEDRILGKPDAPVTIIEYASLTCPHCRHFETDVLPRLKEKWIDTGKVKLVLRDFPLDEPALRAAMVARCAPPDRFYGFVDTFFKSQEEWAVARDPKAALQRLAQLGGMSKKDFDACLANPESENKIVESRLIASQQLDVDATPTFFLNGTKFDGAPTFEAFDQQLSSLAPKS